MSVEEKNKKTKFQNMLDRVRKKIQDSTAYFDKLKELKTDEGFTEDFTNEKDEYCKPTEYNIVYDSLAQHVETDNVVLSDEMQEKKAQYMERLQEKDYKKSYWDEKEYMKLPKDLPKDIKFKTMEDIDR